MEIASHDYGDWQSHNFQLTSYVLKKVDGVVLVWEPINFWQGCQVYSMEKE